MKIFINPGHCPGVDPGACGNGLQEADVVLKIGLLVEKYLQAVGYATKVFQYDGLREIANDANAWGADLFISIHCNAAATNAAKGVETFFCYGSKKGCDLASAIQNQIVNSLPLMNRGVKDANHVVTRETNMPGVLVETAFISNTQDAKLLRDNFDDFARAIARGITDYAGQNAKPVPDVVENHSPAPGKLSEHFDAGEFTCHHCGGGAEKISPRLIELLEQLRANMGGIPLHINSGYRCPVHNANVGGVPNSQHVQGTAADVARPANMKLGEFLWYVQQLPFDWAGVYPASDFIHVDVRKGGVGNPVAVDYME